MLSPRCCSPGARRIGRSMGKPRRSPESQLKPGNFVEYASNAPPSLFALNAAGLWGEAIFARPPALPWSSRSVAAHGHERIKQLALAGQVNSSRLRAQP